MVRTVTDSDVGLKVLREAPVEAEPAQIIDIVAIHSLGAHPDDTWCKNIGTPEEPKWFNWLTEETMLPKAAPYARIMRYGYKSGWFGKTATHQNVSTVADRLLKALRRKRTDVPFRPLIFIAHCFGGLVVLKTLLEAEQYQNEWSGIFPSTTGLIFFGTPFRGAGGMNQMEMLEAARREYHEDQLQPTALEILQPGNAFLQDLVDGFLKKMRAQTNKTGIACFFEQNPSNVGGIVGKQERIRFVVSQDAGCLDISGSTSKHSLSRNHFEMNKFGNAEEEEFEELVEVVLKMIKESPSLLWARSQYKGKHKLEFSLQGMPFVGRFVQRSNEMNKLKCSLLEKPAGPNRRKLVVIHGLGGIGKTQLAIEFVREFHCRFSSAIWLDGSSGTSVRQSFAGLMQRLPQEELTAVGMEMLRRSTIDIDIAVRECLRWLSLPSNKHWLLIFDNVDRDFCNKDDLQAYNLRDYLPSADHGAVLITSRLSSLQRHGLGIKLGTVNAEQARAILENNVGRTVEDADLILDRLEGLPLALTQAGSYMRERNISSLSYAEHYDKTWKRLMMNEGRFPLEEYGSRNILTTWTISYEQIRTQSEVAACLLKLWGLLDHGELWHKLVAAGLNLIIEIPVPNWLLIISEDELEYREAMGLLSRYSLVDAKEGTDSHSIHSVLHKWCGQLADGSERYIFGCIGTALVAYYIPSQAEGEVWSKRKRFVAHVLNVSEWIMREHLADEGNFSGSFMWPQIYYRLGGFLSKEAQLKEAETMYERALRGYQKALGAEHTSTLDTVNNLGGLYLNQGRLEKAEVMYERALRGKEKALGAEHTSTLDTVGSLGILYVEQGRLDEAEEIYERALRGYQKALRAEHTSALGTVSNLGTLYLGQGRLEEAEAMYERALRGYQKALGAEHKSTLDMVNNLGILYKKQRRLDEAEAMYKRALRGYEITLEAEHTSTLGIFHKLGNLYVDQGRLDEAEVMYEQALRGYEKTISPANILTFAPALAIIWRIAELFHRQGRAEHSRAFYKRAISGCAKAYGNYHPVVQALSDRLAALDSEMHRKKESTISDRMLKMLGWKRA